MSDAALKKQRKKASWGSITCADCGGVSEKRGPIQKYCTSCSSERDIKRKNVYAITKGRAKINDKREAWRLKGIGISRSERAEIATWTPSLAELKWYRRIEMPFSYAASKNHIFTTTRTGHTFLRDEARYYRAELSCLIRESVADQRVYQNKLWLDIFVQKINHRGDAANFVDLICDAVKDAIPLDDRWYSIRTLDWQVCKHDPMIFVGLGQEAETDVQACSTCGRMLTFDAFQKNRAMANGVTRVCRSCQSTTLQSRKRDHSNLKAILDIRPGVFE